MSERGDAEDQPAPTSDAAPLSLTVGPEAIATPLVELRGLGKRYGELWAARAISLTVAAGEVYGLLGPNGAGKTTTLRMIAGLLQPDEGEVLIGGQRRSKSVESKKQMGFLTGNTGLYQRLTPVELLRFFGELYEIEPAALEARIAALTEQLDLSSFCDRPCGTLSTGQTQRVNIARTLLHEPALLILDEPTSGLDIISADFILKIIQRCRDEGRAVLLSTHILAETELLCDRVGIIDRGRLVAEGTVDELLAQAGARRLSEAFLHIIHENAASQSTKPEEQTPDALAAEAIGASEASADVAGQADGSDSSHDSRSDDGDDGNAPDAEGQRGGEG